MHMYLVRHGQSHVNLGDLTVEHRDEPLTDLGREQALRAGAWIRENIHVTDFYASSVARTAQTAEIIGDAIDMRPVLRDGLREIGTCRADGTPVAGADFEPFIPELWGTLDPYTPVTPTGESWMQFRSRVGAFIETLVPAARRNRVGGPAAEDSRRILLVAHAGVIEAMFEYIFEKGPWSVVAVETHHTGITHIEYHPWPNRPDWRLHYHNLTHHLTDEMRT
ncbi:MAG: histidine phosphatase family protein [Actinobacteria bacterium]|nr:histidine phosphatase family protein [Actinomycetota bacterium]MCB8995924.1 histidine phosphatase family protein [Actinomycetota bacterium]